MHGWCATFRRLCSECVEWWSLCMMSEEDRQSIRNQLEEYEERKVSCCCYLILYGNYVMIC